MRTTIAVLSIAGIFAIGLIIFGAIQTVSAVSMQNNTQAQTKATQTDRSNSNGNPDAVRNNRFGYGMMDGETNSYSDQASVN